MASTSLISAVDKGLSDCLAAIAGAETVSVNALHAFNGAREARDAGAYRLAGLFLARISLRYTPNGGHAVYSRRRPTVRYFGC